MLAGRMKLTNFMFLAGLAGLGGLGALWFASVDDEDMGSKRAREPGSASTRVPGNKPVFDGPEEPEVIEAAPVQLPALDQVQVVPVPAPVHAGDAVTLAVLSWQGKTASGGKLKDVTKGQPYKVNVYQDEGEATINRAKVDLDRDDKWDIKVTFGVPPTRQIAPSDDEDYSVEEVWDGSRWAPL